MKFSELQLHPILQANLDRIQFVDCTPIQEQAIPREMLYIADEVFFSGTAAEITPIRSVDRIQVGSGSRGPVAKRVQEEFFAITSGKREDRHGWLSPVGVPAATGAR